MSLEGKLTMLAGAIRDKLGVETTFTLDELAETIGGFKLAKDDDGNWKVSYPAVNEDRLACGEFDKGSYGIQVSYDGFKNADWNGVSADLEDGETITKSCSWTVKAPPQGGTFTLVTNCYEASNSNCYLAGVVKDKETKTFDYATLDKMKVGESGLYYKDNPYNWHNKDIKVDIPLEPGETCVVTLFGCVKAASKNRAALYATRYKLVAPETTLIDGIEPVTEEMKDVDVTLTSSLENDDLPFGFYLVSDDSPTAIGKDNKLLRVSTQSNGHSVVHYTFKPSSDASMYIDAALESESNYDYGLIAVDTIKYSADSYKSIKSWNWSTRPDSKVLWGSGKVSSDKNKEIKLKADTQYYLSILYGKDSSGNTGADSVWINSIRIKMDAKKTIKTYHLSQHNYKMTDVFPDTYASLTDNVLKNLDYTHCTTYEGMFDCCTGLTNIELDVSKIPIPEGLTNIVRGCTGLKTITFKGLTADNEGLVTGELIGNTEAAVRTQDSEGKSLRMRYMSASEIEAAKTEINNTRKLVIPDGTEAIPDNAFANMEKVIISAKIPSSVKAIGKNAFYNTKFQCNITAEGIETIGDHAFAYSEVPTTWADTAVDDHTWNFPALKIVESGAFENGATKYTGKTIIFGSKGKGVEDIAADAFNQFIGYCSNKEWDAVKQRYNYSYRETTLKIYSNKLEPTSFYRLHFNSSDISYGTHGIEGDVYPA
ncbi:leucine-rich repeat protein [Selenomonas sp. AE3005]|uniref:leucine-rich repeat protein n=1 Tax=Selenomonas sp. AE3005 TaxID=1485543 RepID=UPI0004868808|nr:leucine-rich repeat domain-containing protein [Selenomonas sp. AE3005]